MKTAVIALGGNAIMRSSQRGFIEEVRQNLRSTVKYIVDLVATGCDVVITHGNGPQVGRLLAQNELLQEQFPPMPLDVCDAQSEGEIGYLISMELDNEMRRRGINKQTLTVITRVMVDWNDNAFENPTKPIGKYYKKEEAESIRISKGWTFREDKARGGWRRVVPSPKPVSIVEIETLKKLIFGGEHQKEVIVAVGGGGVPVIDRNGEMVGVEAVIDKDLAASMLASSINEKNFIILTDVDAVYRKYNTPESERIPRITAEKLKQLYIENQFPAGSMGPKIEAAINFISKGGENAIITSPEMLENAIEGRAGTIVTR